MKINLTQRYMIQMIQMKNAFFFLHELLNSIKRERHKKVSEKKKLNFVFMFQKKFR